MFLYRFTFIPRVGLCILGAALLFSCSLTPESARQAATSPSKLTSQPIAQHTTTATLEIFTTSLPTLTLSPMPLPSTSPTVSPVPRYQIPGRFILFADSEVYEVSVSCIRRWSACSSSRTQLTNTPKAEQEFAAEILLDQIAVSPDGKNIAFAYRQSTEYKGLPEGGWDIYVLDIEACKKVINGCDSQMFTRLTEEPFDEISPAWAPDGSLITFTSNEGPYESFLNPYELFVMQPDGSFPEQLFGDDEISGTLGSIYFPSWSPDSQKIVFNAMTNQYSHPDTFVYTVNRDGSDVRQLTFLPHEENMNKTDFRPQWSPDGTQIMFESNREPPGIYLMNSDGSNIMNISEQGYFPHWSPDGTMIAYISSSALVLHERDSSRFVNVYIGMNSGIFAWTK